MPKPKTNPETQVVEDDETGGELVCIHRDATWEPVPSQADQPPEALDELAQAPQPSGGGPGVGQANTDNSPTETNSGNLGTHRGQPIPEVLSQVEQPGFKNWVEGAKYVMRLLQRTRMPPVDSLEDLRAKGWTIACYKNARHHALAYEFWWRKEMLDE